VSDAFLPHTFPPPPQAVIFDWDNTLADSYSLLLQAFNKTLVHFGHEAITRHELLAAQGQSVSVIFPKLFGTQSAQAQRIFEKHLTQLHHPQPFAGAEALLTMLKKNNIYTAVVSNKKGDLLRKEVAAFRWSSLFESVVGSQDTPEDKPSPVPLFKALENSIHDPGHHVWFVGDSEVDMLCAHRARCMPVSVHRPLSLSSEIFNAKDCFFLTKIIEYLLDNQKK
jgi:phosphoglycolate phosphatase